MELGLIVECPPVQPRVLPKSRIRCIGPQPISFDPTQFPLVVWQLEGNPSICKERFVIFSRFKGNLSQDICLFSGGVRQTEGSGKWGVLCPGRCAARGPSPEHFSRGPSRAGSLFSQQKQTEDPPAGCVYLFEAPPFQGWLAKRKTHTFRGGLLGSYHPELAGVSSLELHLLLFGLHVQWPIHPVSEFHKGDANGTIHAGSKQGTPLWLVPPNGSPVRSRI